MSCYVTPMPSSGGSQWELIDGNWTMAKSRKDIYYTRTATAFREALTTIYAWIDTTLQTTKYNEWTVIACGSASGSSNAGGQIYLSSTAINQFKESVQQKFDTLATSDSNVSLPAPTADNSWVHMIMIDSRSTSCRGNLLSLALGTAEVITACLYGRKV